MTTGGHLDDTPLDALSAQVRSRPSLTEARIDDLLHRARRDPHGAPTQELVEGHLDVALAAALERRDRGLDVPDLYQEGAIAVLVAVEEYLAHGDTRPGPLRGYVERVVAVHLDAALEAQATRVADEERFVRDAELLQAAEVRLRHEFGRDPTAAELGALLEWPPQRVELMQEMLHAAMELHDAEILQYLDDDEERPG